MTYPSKPINLTASFPLVLVMLLSVSTAFGQGQAFSLQQAQNYAVSNSFQAKDAALDVDKAKQQVREVRSLGLPQISGDVTFQHFLDIPVQVAQAGTFSFGDEFNNWVGGVSQATGVNFETPPVDPNAVDEFQFGLKNSFSAGVSVNQLIFSGPYIVALQSSKTFLEASRTAQDKTETDLRQTVAEAYHNALVATDGAAILAENLAELEKNLSQMREVLKAGLMDETDVDQLELTVANVRNTKENMERQADIAKMALKFAMGLDVNTEITLTDKIEDLVTNLEGETLLSQNLDLSGHIDYKLIESQESLNQLTMKSHKYERMPSLGGFFTHSQNAYSDKVAIPALYPTTLVGLKLTVPIWDGMGQSSKIRQADIEVMRTQNNKEMLEQNLRMQLELSRSAFLSARAQYETEKANLALAQRILSRTLIKQKNGMASSLDVTTANSQYLTTQSNFIQAQVRVLNARIALMKALGR